MKLLLATLTLALAAASASADSIWQYQGSPMNGCSCALTGQVTLSDAGQITQYDFTDGTHDLNSSNSTGYLHPSLSGDFSQWSIQLTGADWIIRSIFWSSLTESSDLSLNLDASIAFGEEGMPGVWTDPPAPTAEPSTILLIAAGVVLLLLRKVRIHL